jgi:hypothetical protein
MNAGTGLASAFRPIQQVGIAVDSTDEHRSHAGQKKQHVGDGALSRIRSAIMNHVLSN